MKFMNPYGVSCEACGLQQSHAPDNLLSQSARCVKCGIPLLSAGRAMHAMILDPDVFATKIELALELEEVFGASLDDECIASADNVEQYVAGIFAANPALFDRAKEIRTYVIRHLQKCVSTERLIVVERLSFHQLLAKI